MIGKGYNSALNLSPISRPSLNGEVEFKNVTYQFDGSKQPTVNNISFKITPGQKVAIVGKMGSGKSTLSKLMAGMIEPTSGSILVDGIDVRQIDQADIKKILVLCFRIAGSSQEQSEKTYKWDLMNMMMIIF